MQERSQKSDVTHEGRRSPAGHFEAYHPAMQAGPDNVDDRRSFEFRPHARRPASCGSAHNLESQGSGQINSRIGSPCDRTGIGRPAGVIVCNPGSMPR